MPTHAALFAGAVASAAITCLAMTARGDDLRLTVAARSGDPAPFVGPGVAWAGFQPGLTATYISPSGEIVGSGVLSGVGVDADNENILFVGRPGNFRVVAREGGTSPDLPAGVVFDQTPFGLTSPGGRVLFAVTLRGPGISTANDIALLLEPAPGSGEPARVLLREGEQAPELPAGVNILVMDLSSVSINDEVRVAVSATLSGVNITSANGQVMYRSNPDSAHVLRLVARAGDPAPALGTALRYGSVATPQLRPNGDLIATLSRTGPDITSANDRTISLVPAGSTTPMPLYIEGEPVPGRPGANFESLGLAVLTREGQLAFFSTISENLITRQALWTANLDVPGSLRAIAVTGEPAPGLVANATYSSLSSFRYDVSASGRGGFVSTVTGTGIIAANDTVLYSEAPGAPSAPLLLGREGLPGPDVFPIMNLGSLTAGNVNVALNSRNQTAWIAPVGTMGDTGYFYTDSTAVVRLLAREGGPFELEPGDVRTIDLISGPVLQAGQSPWRRWFNDAGQSALLMSFAGTPPTSALVLVELDPGSLCRADFNQDGEDTLQDLFDFLFAWFGGQPSADINGVDGVTVQDLFDYLFLWFAGCP